MIRVLVADDQPMARERLTSLLAAESDIELAAATASGPETVAAIRKLAPDLVFLDMRMPGMDGFDVIEEIGVERMPLTVFVTAYDEYAVRAFDVQALDYLLKPFARPRFQAALARARERLDCDRQTGSADRLAEFLRLSRSPSDRRNRVLVKSEGRMSFVDAEQIDWVEAEGNYVRIHAGDQVHVMRETMHALLEKIGQDRFFRIHRSRIVNVHRVKELLIAGGGDYQVVLLNGQRLGLSRMYREALQQQLTNT